MKERQEHIPFLDHLRALAILMVFFFHALDASFGSNHFLFQGWFRDIFAGPLPLFLTPLTFGFLGVAIFFVVSGFCIHLSHERSRNKSWSTFTRRRFFRIYPPYLVALLLFTFLFPPSRLDFHSGFSAQLYQFLTHLFLVYNFDGTTYQGINPAFWSIAVEVQLYLLYPVLLLITRMWGWYRALWITGVIEIGLRVVMGALHHDLSFKPYLPGLPFLYWYSWTIGAALAESYLKKQPLPFARTPLFFWPAITLAACMFEPLYPFCFLFAALSTARLISYLLRRQEQPAPAARPPGLISRYVQFIGVISYSIYLLHQPLVNSLRIFLHWLAPDLSFSGLALYAMCLGVWILITFLAYGFYRLVELPSIALGKWIENKKRARAPDLMAAPAAIVK